MDNVRNQDSIRLTTCTHVGIVVMYIAITANQNSRAGRLFFF